MSSYLCISIRFADPEPAFRGRGDGGEPEWPPSPLRVFQALVAAAAARFGNPERFLDYGAGAFGWLGALGAPIVFAPPGERGTPFRTAVPNNDMDIVAAGWARREEPRRQPSQLKALKTVQPTHLRGPADEHALHYLWEVPPAQQPGFAEHKELLFAAARSIAALGWGVDMAVGCGRELDTAGRDALKGERWEPTATDGGVRLRVPTADTFSALVQRHGEFVQQLHGGGYSPVPPLTAFETVGYRRDTDPTGRPFAAFRIASVDPDAPNPSFDTPRHCAHVAAWVRHATGQACAGWPFGDPAPFVHGHVSSTDRQPLRGEGADNRFMYLPLPSIERRGDRGEHVGAIRRVLVAAPPGFADRVEWVRRRLAGRELVWGDTVHGLLADLPGSDWVLGRYTGEARVWSTVTPVVLPGYDDPAHVRRRLRANRESAAPSAAVQRELLNELEDGVRGALLRAFAHAGLAALVEPDQLGWRNVGFLPGVEPASEFARDEHHRRFSVYHVRVRFAQPVRGPLAVGAGRYRGLGLFASVEG